MSNTHSSLGPLRRAVRNLSQGPSRRRNGRRRTRRLVLEPLEVRNLLAAADLDAMFGTASAVTTSFGTSDELADMALTSGGSIVTAGSSDAKVLVAKYSSAGVLDSNFGTGGRFRKDVNTEIPLGINLQKVTGVALQADGKILVAGWGDDAFGTQTILIRLLADGSLDPSFGPDANLDGVNDGAISMFNFRVADVAVTTDGDGNEHILLAGTNLVPDLDFALFSVDPAGGLEREVAIDFSDLSGLPTSYGGNESVTRMLVRPDGGVLLAGYLDDFGLGGGFALAKLTPNLIRDFNFGNSGRVITTGANATRIEGVVVQPDGNIVVAGVTNAGKGGFLLARYDETTGALDPSFDASDADPTDDLLHIVPPASATFVRTRDMAIQADGKIAIVGDDFTPNLSLGIAVARIHPNGTNDNEFSTSSMEFFQPDWQARVLRIQTDDGKILVGGKTALRGDTDFALFRLEGDSIALNTAPVANDDSYTVQEDMPRDLQDGGFPFWGNDTDADGDYPLTPRIVSGPSFGTLTTSGVAPDIVYTYTPALNYFGEDQITYQVEDARGALSNVAVITLSIQSENDPLISLDIPENTSDVAHFPHIS